MKLFEMVLFLICNTNKTARMVSFVRVVVFLSDAWSHLDLNGFICEACGFFVMYVVFFVLYFVNNFWALPGVPALGLTGTLVIYLKLFVTWLGVPVLDLLELIVIYLKLFLVWRYLSRMMQACSLHGPPMVWSHHDDRSIAAWNSPPSPSMVW